MPTNKHLVWFIEESTPLMAQHMHALEQSLGGQATVLRVSYTDALKLLPGVTVREDLVAIVVFSATMLHQIGGLLGGLRAPHPRLCWVSPNLVHLSEFRLSSRLLPQTVIVTRHEGETAWLRVLGLPPEHVMTLNVSVDPERLSAVDARSQGQLRVGVAWYNLCDSLRKKVALEVARWRSRAPGRLHWQVVCLPGDEPDPAEWPETEWQLLTPDRLAAGPIPVDVWLCDPWWPDGAPGVWQAPVQIHLPPAGIHPESWQERLQTLLDCLEPANWEANTLWQFAYQPFWRQVLKGEGRAMPPMTSDDDPVLPKVDDALTRALDRLPLGRELQDTSGPALAYYFWNYDYAVECLWCQSLFVMWREARATAKAHTLLSLNALRLHQTSAAWLLKRSLAKSPPGRMALNRQRLGWRFWLRFMYKDTRIWLEWLHTLWRCGRDTGADPLGATRTLARAVLARANISITRHNAPEPIPGVPVLYLVCHRHAELDPFLMLNILDGNLAVVVGQRVQRWPLISRLTHSAAFVVTGKEHGVIIADAIAALRAQRALALYPEVTVPSYLGEGTPIRTGILWILQAFEQTQVIPVVLSDAFALGALGGHVSVWYGKPILSGQDATHRVLDQVRQFYHQHLPLTQALHDHTKPI